MLPVLLPVTLFKNPPEVLKKLVHETTCNRVGYYFQLFWRRGFRDRLILLPVLCSASGFPGRSLVLYRLTTTYHGCGQRAGWQK